MSPKRPRPSAPPAASRPPDPGLARIHAEVKAQVETLLRSEEFTSFDDLNARLGELVAGMNLAPQRDFGGLSADDVHRLLTHRWLPRGGPVTLAHDVPATAVRDTPGVRDARVLLDMLAAAPLALTPRRRTLPARAARAFIARRGTVTRPTRPYDLLDRDAGHDPALVRGAALALVDRLVQLLIDGGLAGVDPSGLVLTEVGERLRAPQKAGVLWERLVRTHFTAGDFGPFAVPPDGAPSLQDSIAYTLCRFQRLDDHHRNVAELTELLVLPSTLDAVDRLAESAQLDVDVMATAVDLYVLMPLANFGLADCEPDDGPFADPAGPPRFRYRPSALMRRAFRFDVRVPR